MTRDEMVAMAWGFWQLQMDGKLDEAFDLLHPDGGYASICMPSWEPMQNSSGWLKKFNRILVERMTIRFSYIDAIVEGDRVVLRFSGEFEIPGDDRVHDQSYLMINTFRDGKIFLIEEFLDTKKEEPLVQFIFGQVEADEGAAAIPSDAAQVLG